METTVVFWGNTMGLGFPHVPSLIRTRHFKHEPTILSRVIWKNFNSLKAILILFLKKPPFRVRPGEVALKSPAFTFSGVLHPEGKASPKERPEYYMKST